MSLSPNILIVENHPSDSESMLRQLSKAGFTPTARIVETESDYLAALEPSPDIILADYDLPQFSGLRALELLQRRGLDIPFILVFSKNGNDRVDEAIQRGATDYVLK